MRISKYQNIKQPWKKVNMNITLWRARLSTSLQERTTR